MNCKIFLLALLLVFNPNFLASSTSGNSKSQASTHQQGLPEPVNHNSKDKSLEPITWSDDWSHLTNDLQHPLQNSDDDGKPHHYHFTRIQKRRIKMFLCYGSRALLIFSHLASLIYAFTHIMHY